MADNGDGNQVLAPSGRPLNYTGSHGWQSRIMSGSLASGSFGTSIGLLVGAWKEQNALRWAASTGCSFALAGLSFYGAKEIVRELRAAHPDDVLNAIIGGFASGAALGRFQGSPRLAFQGAIIFASLGTLLHQGELQWRDYRLRKFLASLPPEAFPDFVQPIEKRPGLWESLTENFKLPEWFPIQILSDEQAEERARIKKALQSLQAVEPPTNGDQRFKA